MESANNKYDVRDCPICLEPFPTKPNVTVLKPCLHVVCDECFNRHVCYTSSRTASPIPEVPCPTCKKVVDKPVNTVFTMGQLVDLTTPTPPASATTSRREPVVIVAIPRPRPYGDSRPPTPPTPAIVPAPTPQVDISPVTLPPTVLMNEARFNVITRMRARRRAQPHISPRTRRYNRRNNGSPPTPTHPGQALLDDYIELRVNRLLSGGLTDMAQLSNLTVVTPSQASLINDIRRSIQATINQELDDILSLRMT